VSAGVSPTAALVTGGAGGIGRAVARALSDKGHPVAVVDVDRAAAEAVANELRAHGGQALAVECDVADGARVSRALDEIESALGGLHLGVAVLCAGVGGPFHRADEVDEKEWDALFAVNVKGVFHVCRLLLPRMREAGFGRVIAIASMQGLFGAVRSSTYAATKHAVVGYVRSLGAEWGAHGITCNAVCPGYVDTRLGARDDAHHARIVERTPAARLASPDEVAALCAFLASPEAGFINGAALPIDGGLGAHLATS
jgi:3-oxoacyl-[acyl-carrier protein] reductase